MDRTPGFNKAKAKEQASLKLASKKILQESNSSFFTPKSMLIIGGIGFSLLAMLFIIFKRKKKKDHTKDVPDNTNNSITHAEHSSKESIVQKRDSFNLDLQVLASKMNDSEDYIQLVCE